jgi:hypothetical protein
MATDGQRRQHCLAVGRASPAGEQRLDLIVAQRQLVWLGFPAPVALAFPAGLAPKDSVRRAS